MDELPISLVSNDLKYTLSSLKIKTIQKARQYIIYSNDKQKIEKVKKYLNRYDQTKNQINKKINLKSLNSQDQINFNDINNNLNKAQYIFQDSIHSNSIVQLFGGKGVGKTSLLLYFCQKFSQKSNKKLYFINCASGITYKRWQRLSKKCSNIQYRDAYMLDQILSVCKSSQQDHQTGCIAVDSLTNLLMQQQKTLIFLIKLFKIFSNLINRGVKIYITNYVQQWFQHRQQDFLTNHYSYYSSVTSQFIKYKYFLKKWPKSQKVDFSMIKGAYIKGQYQIGKDGIISLKLN